MRDTARDAGRHVPHAVVRLTGSVDDAASAVPVLAAAGVTEVIVEVDWSSADGPERTLEQMRSSAS